MDKRTHCAGFREDPDCVDVDVRPTENQSVPRAFVLASDRGSV